jgi:hypothetical protein
MADGKIVSPGVIAQMIVMKGVHVDDLKVKLRSAASLPPWSRARVTMKCKSRGRGELAAAHARRYKRPCKPLGSGDGP